MAGRLCEHTLATLPPPDGGPACFEVLDLSQDARFSQLDFVKGKPFFRNYVGVPLRTRKGINIGSLFIINSKVRPALSSDERQFLGIMAANVIQHLEMDKEKRDHQRTFNRHRCLSTYVDPEFQRKHRVKSPSRTVLVRASSATPRADCIDAQVGSAERHEIFTPAAELLREALDLKEGGGGVVFLDPIASLGRPQLAQADADKSDSSSGPDSDSDECAPSCQPHLDRNSSPLRTHSTARHSCGAHRLSTEVLAHARYPVPRSPTLNKHHFQPPSPEDLSKLTKRYPRGKLFTFDSEDHIVSSSEEDEATKKSSFGDGHTRSSKSHKASKHLRSHFSMARQVIFLPLWDPTTSRTFTCFIYNCSDYRDFSRNSELLYCITFTNCVMAEIARLAALKANQQKSDFIGSISHELRSPLHGILASCEFLEDTECSMFQRSLIDTADSCARTLLDTINMVLDYSNINTFEKESSRARKSRRSTRTKGSPPETLQSNLSVYQYVDVAAMTEEVVDGVATGHAFTNRPHTPEHDSPLGRHNMSHPQQSQQDYPSCDNGMDLIIDIPTRDWTYWSQPGALRRIVMNIVSNSLKYTKHGFIHVKLEAHQVGNERGSQAHDLITLTVTDSGQGMSAVYMADRLYTPFAQESSLTPGTGLGLSLVKSIVNMLDGRIDIDSAVGVGTKVTVELPLPRGTFASNANKSLSTSVASVVERVKEDSLEVVRSLTAKRNVAMYSSHKHEATKSQTKAKTLMRESLEVYLREWCGFTVYPWAQDTHFDVVISERSDLSDLIQVAPRIFKSEVPTVVLVLCDTAKARDLEHAHIDSNKLEQLRYPIGPYKFARALRTCFEHLERSDGLHRGFEDMILGDHTQAKPMTPAEAIASALSKISVSANGEAMKPVMVDTHSSTFQGGIIGQMVTNNVEQLHADEAAMPTTIVSESFPPDELKSPDSDGGVQLPEKVLNRPKTPNSAPKNQNTSTPQQHNPVHTASILGSTSTIEKTTSPSISPTLQLTCPPRLPRMLLVDDNAINLRLLQVFMKKRKYTCVTTALDGQQAVSAYRTALYAAKPAPPDIILMDINMPILDGFEATRQIRGLERDWNARVRARRKTGEQQQQHDDDYARKKLGAPLDGDLNDEPRRQVKALIIALTGLASVRDQKEAFACGADVYMMKPASFAKLSGIMDGWEQRGGARTGDEVL